MMLLWLALVKILIHLWQHPAYGYFRDELYYIACAEHLDWGYVDHPPLSIAVLAATRALLGDSMFAIRLPVVLAGAAMVVLTGLLARELGGGRFAQALAAMGFIVMPVMLVMSTFFSMNALDLLFWAAAVYAAVRMIRTGEPRWWLGFGVVVGLGLMNKISVGFLVLGIVLGLLLTAPRLLLNRWFWLGGTIAALIFLPHVIWQLAHGVPTVEFMRNAATLKIAPMSAAEFLGAQILYTNPATVPIWIAGLASFLFLPALRPFRFLGIAFLFVLVLLIVQGGKPYYLAPGYPMLLAAGGVAWERLSARRGWHWLRPVLVLLVSLIGLAVLPLAVPVLSPQTFARYAAAIGVEAPQEERGQRVELPQPFADRFGWENMVATIARAYHALPPQEQARAVIFASNYGEAGAVDFFGPRYGLPRAISSHNSYWLWGPGDREADLAIVVGVPRERLDDLCGEVTHSETIVSPYAAAFETNLPVHVCRRFKRPLHEVWPELKRYV
jgi:4-amino-4-deoxy-L-arabinose transferase-like glycosyltransferase